MFIHCKNCVTHGQRDILEIEVLPAGLRIGCMTCNQNICTIPMNKLEHFFSRFANAECACCRCTTPVKKDSPGPKPVKRY